MIYYGTTCIDGGYDITFNNQPLDEVWVCKTSNATCTLVWQKQKGLIVTGNNKAAFPINCAELYKLDYLGDCRGCNEWTITHPSGATVAIGGFCSEYCFLRFSHYYKETLKFTQPFVTLTNLSNVPVTVCYVPDGCVNTDGYKACFKLVAGCNPSTVYCCNFFIYSCGCTPAIVIQPGTTCAIDELEITYYIPGCLSARVCSRWYTAEYCICIPLPLTWCLAEYVGFGDCTPTRRTLVQTCYAGDHVVLD